MPAQVRQKHATTSISLKVGDWFEAHATGWGVLAIPLVLVLLLAAGLIKLCLS